ncbi:MAG: hypothetical protein L6R42_003209 [Xanthoria sp. 1 TBL-2021]|nr:MAG: hypothetical protein L6R42_003209 [Xanthoria sp. 1 TBL-2021]
MTPPNVQDAGPSDGSAHRSGSVSFENVVRGMILGHDSPSIESEAPQPTSRQQQQPALHVPTSDTNDAPMPNRQHTHGTRQSQDPARSKGKPQDKQSSSSGQKPQPQRKKDTGATNHGDAPVEYTMRQARQPRRRQAARVNQASTTNSGPAVPTAGLSISSISNASPQSEQQPSSQLRQTPAAAFNSHARPQDQPRLPLPHGSQPRRLQPSQPNNLQQRNQRVVPPSSSYGRPPPQHQRLYDPRAASQQSYHDSAMWGRQSSRFSSSQSHHLTVQAQINYLDSMAQLQIPKVTISSEEEQQKEALRRVLENVCQKAITEYEVAKEPPFDGSTVSLKCFGSLRTGFATRSSDMDLALGSPQSIPDAALPESDIPRVLEKALLDLGYGARLLTRTRVPIIRFCEKPTPDLAVRLREERLKWEKERDASPRAKKPKDSKAELTSKQHSKDSAIEKKGKGAKGKQSQAKSPATHCRGEQLESETQDSTVSTSEQAAEAKNVPTKHPATENAHAEEVDEQVYARNEFMAQNGNVTPRDQRYSAENPAEHVDSASGSVNDFFHSETEPTHDLDVSRDTEASQATNSTNMVATGLMRLSMAKKPDSPEEKLGQANIKIEPQALPSGRAETLNTDKTVGQAAEPQPRLESTLPDEEIVRLYKLAIKEGWFEPEERGLIFAFIKAFENKSSQDQLTACRSQLLALPDVLSRYRPPPEHHLDFPKDGVGVQCDINFSNRLALHNSHMLRCYNLSDPRVRPMVLFVKAWAKRRKINSPYHGTLSSYGYVLMVLHYLVNVARPPICLNLQTVEMAGRDTSAENTQIVDGYSVRFWRDEKEIQQWSQNSRITADQHSSVGSLLRGFFQYFAVVSGGFSWGTDVLSLRTPGGILSKQQKDWIAAKTVVLEPAGEGQKGQEVRQRYLFAIEDPFETNHNIARTVVHNGIVAIRDEFRRANRLIHEAGNGRITEDLFEEAEAKDDLNYRHFGPRPRPPQQTKAAATALGTASSEGKQTLNQTATDAEQQAKKGKPSSTTPKVV